MKACAFFGCSKGHYEKYKKILRNILIDLIEKENVTQFYSGGRGAFDEFCSQVVGELRNKYPFIKNTLVISYLPMGNEKKLQATKYTDSVYFLERSVPPRYAIVETNKEIVKHSDFIIVATKYSFGGARKAREYAEKKEKQIIDIERTCKKKLIVV